MPTADLTTDKVAELVAEAHRLTARLRFKPCDGADQDAAIAFFRDTARALESLAASRRDALALLFTHTRICPFGGGKNGERTCCVFGHPGCACDDFVADLTERIFTTSEEPRRGVSESRRCTPTRCA